MRRPIIAGIVLWIAFGCADRLAGGSSGVDNPEIAVGFTGAGGTPRSVTGSLGLYNASQNPAVNPLPLAEIQLLNVTSAVLRAETSGVVTLRPFAKAGAGAVNTITEYNLLLRTGGDSGFLQMRLVYDDTAQKFIVEDRYDTVQKTLPFSVSRFVRYTGWLHRDSVGPGPDRVFIPGTPFQAVVVDSAFTFPALPEGVYTIKVFTAAGWEYAVRGSLDTKVPGIFTLDSAQSPSRPDGINPDTTLTAFSGEDHGAFLETDNFLSGDVSGVETGGLRQAILWRQISGPAKAIIEDPTALRTPVIYTAAGAYQFVLSVSFGLASAYDTVLVGLRSVNAGVAAFIEPTVEDTLRRGQVFNVIWQGRAVENLKLDLSLDSGATWSTVNSTLASNLGLGIYSWTPAASLGTADFCRLRFMAQDSSIVAISENFLIR